MSTWLGNDTDFPHKDEYSVCTRDRFFGDSLFGNIILVILCPLTYLLYIMSNEWKVVGYFKSMQDAIEFKSIIRFPKQNRGMVSFLKGYSKTGPIITGTPAGTNKRFTMQDWNIATL